MSEIPIVDYNPSWPDRFSQEERRIREAVAKNLLLRVEHVGSTSVPGLAAKPIIDILALVRTVQNPDQTIIKPLRAINYTFKPVMPTAQGLIFQKRDEIEKRRTYNLHVHRIGKDQLKRLAFRDHLRENLDIARQYEVLKRELATRHYGDLYAYQTAKRAFIEETLARLSVPGK